MAGEFGSYCRKARFEVGSRPPFAKTTAKYGITSAPTTGIAVSQPRWFTNMRRAVTKQAVLMPIMIRYRRSRYEMSCDRPGRASVTRYGWSRRECGTLFTPPRYSASGLPASRPGVASESRSAWVTVRVLSDGVPGIGGDHDRPHLPRDRDRRHVSRGHRAGHQGRPAPGRADAASPRLV